MLVFSPAVRRLRQHLPDLKLPHLLLLEEADRNSGKRPIHCGRLAAEHAFHGETVHRALDGLAKAGLVDLGEPTSSGTVVILTTLAFELIYPVVPGLEAIR